MPASPTERKIAEMLLENTGSHFLDSGGAYGRAWQHERARLGLDGGLLLTELRRPDVILVKYLGFLLGFHQLEFALKILNLRRDNHCLDVSLSPRLVNDVNSLIRQVTVGDVTLGEFGS